MKFAAIGMGMAVALVVLVVVALNMDSPPEKEELDHNNLPLPEMAAMGGDSVTVPTDYRPESIAATALTSISRPKTVSAEGVGDSLSDDDLVVGIVLNGESRAYPLGYLAGMNRSVLNDQLGGVDIAVTWDDVNQCAAVYDRKVGGQDSVSLILQHSGKLWRSNTVFQDLGSESQWSQLTTKCESGQMKDQSLRLLPSVLIRWDVWKTEQPESTVIQPISADTPGTFRVTSMDDSKSLVVGILGYKEQNHYRRDRLMQHSVINDMVEKKPVVIFTDPTSLAVRAFEATVDGEALEFDASESGIVDRQTRSTWDLKAGTCESGKLAGKSLKRIATIPVKQSTWKKFYSRSNEWMPKE